MKTNQKLIKDTADQLVKELKELGFTIQRYDAMSTSSIYLKLDFGVCNSIRISDHRGKKHLAYRFNLCLDITNSYVNLQGKYPRYYYGFNRKNQLIESIIAHRQDKIDQYGEAIYQSFMRQSKVSNQDNAGFWQSAVLV